MWKAVLPSALPPSSYPVLRVISLGMHLLPLSSSLFLLDRVSLGNQQACLQIIIWPRRWRATQVSSLQLLRFEACTTTPSQTSCKITSLIGLGPTQMAAFQNSCLFKGPGSICFLKKQELSFSVHIFRGGGGTVEIVILLAPHAKAPEVPIFLLISDISAN